MPLAKTASPKSPQEYDQEGREDDANEFKSQAATDRELKANMKALRLLDQSQVKSTKEADRNYNSNMAALKLLDEVAGGESFKPQPAIPGMDLSPKQYSDQEDVEEGDDILAVDDIKRYKKSDFIIKERAANYKALRLIDESFGGEANNKCKPHRAAPPKMSKGSLSSKKHSDRQDFKEGDDIEAVDDDFKRYRKAEDIRRESGANFKALRLIDESFGGEANKKCKPHRATLPKMTSTGGVTMRAAATAAYVKEKEQKYQAKAMVKEAKKYEMDSRPKKLVKDKKLEEMATSTRKKKLTPEDVRDPETVAGMKCEYDYQLESDAKKKALKLVDSESLVLDIV
jgi:hypothetical protein